MIDENSVLDIDPETIDIGVKNFSLRQSDSNPVSVLKQTEEVKTDITEKDNEVKEIEESDKKDELTSKTLSIEPKDDSKQKRELDALREQVITLQL